MGNESDPETTVVVEGCKLVRRCGNRRRPSVSLSRIAARLQIDETYFTGDPSGRGTRLGTEDR